MPVRPLTALILTCALAVAAAPAAARPVEGEDDALARQLSLARQASLMGDVDQAVSIYEAILAEHPDDLRAFWGLAGTYAQAGMDRDHLVPLLEKRVAAAPGDVRALSELGSAYARLGEQERARGAWAKALHAGRPDEGRYADIAGLEVRYGMVDDAVLTYEEARQVFHRPSLFAQDLARSRTFLQDYDGAIDECLLTLGEHPGLVQWATNSVELMLDQGAERGDVRRRMDAIVGDRGATPTSLCFAGSTYLALGEPKRALEAFLTADERARDDGQLLLDYGEVLSDSGEAGEAREAFNAIRDRHPETAYAATAGVRVGEILAGQGDIEAALAQLKSTGATYTRYPEGGNALLAAARIELDSLHAPDAAIATIDSLLSGDRSRGRQLVQEADLVKIDAFLALGRFDDAHTTAEDVLSSRAHSEVRERAMFALGYASFLKDDDERAVDELREMVKDDASGKLVNDALRLMLVIAETEQELGAEPLREFARAHAARLAGRAEEAESILAGIADAYPGTTVGTQSLLLRAQIASESGDPDQALKLYRDVIDRSDSLSARAQAMISRADLLAARGRRDEAIAQYTSVLEELPPNTFSGEARRKIEVLRRGKGGAG